MDINEINIEMRHRHPWELSRTDCVLRALGGFLQNRERGFVCVDLGAGDQFFDDALLDRAPNAAVYAVDIGYTPDIAERLRQRVRNADRVHMARSLAELGALQADLAVMMDSLEYMESETDCLTALAAHVKPGGLILLTVPAFQLLFSEFDRDVNGRCRYNRKDLRRILAAVPGVELRETHYFYTSLFAVRLLQKLAPLRIDPQHKVISGWPYARFSPLTRLVKGALDLDFRVNAFLGKAGLDLPGLSLLAVCEKRGDPFAADGGHTT